MTKSIQCKNIENGVIYMNVMKAEFVERALDRLECICEMG